MPSWVISHAPATVDLYHGLASCCTRSSSALRSNKASHFLSLFCPQCDAHVLRALHRVHHGLQVGPPETHVGLECIFRCLVWPLPAPSAPHSHSSCPTHPVSFTLCTPSPLPPPSYFLSTLFSTSRVAGTTAQLLYAAAMLPGFIVPSAAPYGGASWCVHACVLAWLAWPLHSASCTLVLKDRAFQCDRAPSAGNNHSTAQSRKGLRDASRD